MFVGLHAGLMGQNKASLLMHFNEGKGQVVKDLSGMENHGILGRDAEAREDDPGWAENGKEKTALRFDGVYGNYVNIKNSPSLNPDKFLYLSAWIKMNKRQESGGIIINKGWGVYNLFINSNGSVCFTYRNELNQFVSLDSKFKLKINHWYKVTLKVDANLKTKSICIKVDGKDRFCAKFKGNGFWKKDTHNVDIGYNSTQKTGPFAGMIDDVIIAVKINEKNKSK